MPDKLKVSVSHLHPGKVSTSFMLSLIRLLLFEKDRGVIALSLNSHKANAGDIPVGRNQLTKDFLASDNKYLFMVDSDMGFAPDCLDRLLADRKSVIGGLCFALRTVGTDPETCADRFEILPTLIAWDEEKIAPVRMTDYPRNQVIPIYSTGAACLLIERSVLERMRDEYGENWWTPLPNYTPGEHAILSEDVSFFTRLNGCKTRSYVDTSVKTSHDKGGIFLTEREWEGLDRP